MLKLNVDKLHNTIRRSSAFQTVGRLHSAREVKLARLSAAVGQFCEIRHEDGRRVLCEVVGFDGESCQLLSYHKDTGLRPGLDVVTRSDAHRIPVGIGLLGRVLNGLGQPIDDRGPIEGRRYRDIESSPPDPLSRAPIHRPFVTGQRVIDGLLTIGRGQRVGLFAGSGVGKSTLLGEIAKVAESDINVIVLVGERGREVRPFLVDCLGEEGLRRSVVLIATSDESPLMRVRIASTGIAIAESFRDEGLNVLFMMDSVTRLAMAQREIGLLLGEPPGARGYPPSAIHLLAQTLERLGTSERGCITGLITVLVDGDDFDEPVSDAVRSILDGHIVLSRKLASRGHYPAVDVLMSVSRLFTDVVDREHQQAAEHVRQMLATYEEMADLIQIGAYTQGASPKVDRVIQLRPAIDMLLRQATGTATPIAETRDALIALAHQWQPAGSAA
ncbi:MAG: FliI/YscN family ATPase [Planctomycetaceae bacterium]|nr:FliI/YscN family ATPase [Planctomycetaceae bacterium]